MDNSLGGGWWCPCKYCSGWISDGRKYLSSGLVPLVWRWKILGQYSDHTLLTTLYVNNDRFAYKCEDNDSGHIIGHNFFVCGLQSGYYFVFTNMATASMN